MSPSSQPDWFGRRLLEWKAIMDNPPPRHNPGSDSDSDNGLLTPNPSQDGDTANPTVPSATLTASTAQGIPPPFRRSDEQGQLSPGTLHSTRRRNTRAAEAVVAKKRANRKKPEKPRTVLGGRSTKIMGASDISSPRSPHHSEWPSWGFGCPGPVATKMSERTRSHTHTSTVPFCRLGSGKEILVERGHGDLPPPRQKWLRDGTQAFRVQKYKRERTPRRLDRTPYLIDDAYLSVFFCLVPPGYTLSQEAEAATEMTPVDMVSSQGSMMW